MKSNLCNYEDFSDPKFIDLMHKLNKDPNHIHRKHWEYYYIHSAVEKHLGISSGLKGLVFGAGMEILPSLFASYNMQIVATDKVDGTGWDHNGQHSKNKKDLFHSEVVSGIMFDKNVSFESCDMNGIPDKFNEQFDFVWSTCSLEHIGSLQHGINFIENSIKCVRPGGLIVHTTEFNLSSNTDTINAHNLCFYRKCDLDYLDSKYNLKLDYTFDYDKNCEEHMHIMLDQLGYKFTSVGLTILK